MKNHDLSKGKKLNKRELKVITGGLEMCIDPATGQCRKRGLGCAERMCRIEDPVIN